MNNSSMTPRTRMLNALKGLPTDRIAVCPDIYAMIPCRLTGKPYWEVYCNENPPLWKAYIDAAEFFDIDALSFFGDLRFTGKTQLGYQRELIKHNDHWMLNIKIETPDGDLTQKIYCPENDVVAYPENLIKDFKNDFKKIKHLFSDVKSYDKEKYEYQRKTMGERGITSICIMPPGYQIFSSYFNGSLEAIVYAHADEPDLFEELICLYERRSMQELEIALDCNVDCILTGGSGSITLQSPDLWKKISFPAIKKITELSRQAGVISGIHSCGKEKYLVEMCAQETDLDFVNPLEIAPMGDCDLKDLLDRFGDKITLMGNLHTVDVMLNGSPELVEKYSKEAIFAARGKRFVLSTGDQCPRDTPFANIHKMVEVSKKFTDFSN